MALPIYALNSPSLGIYPTILPRMKVIEFCDSSVVAVVNHERLRETRKIAIVVICPVVLMMLQAPLSSLFASPIANGLGVSLEKVL
jgi:hypothetical protein